MARVTLPTLEPDGAQHRGYGFAQYASLVRILSCACTVVKAAELQRKLMVHFAHDHDRCALCHGHE